MTTKGRRDRVSHQLSDGSSSDIGVGASAVMYETGQPGHTDRKVRLGNVTDHTTYKAELVGPLMAVHLAAKVPPNSTVSVYVDNQSTLAAITSPPNGPGSHIIEALNEAMKSIATRRPVLAKRIVFRWISAHSGVEGNEVANQLAKEAAAGDTSPANLLPDMLTSPLPRSPTAVKAEFRKILMKEWTHVLEKSPRRERLHRIDPILHPAKFYKLVSDLHRGHSSLVNQLRSNHVALNFYLHRIQKRDDPYCEHCPTDRETVQHFLLECPARREARRTTLDLLGRNSRSISYLLSTSKGIEAMVRYVAISRRFQRPED